MKLSISVLAVALFASASAAHGADAAGKKTTITGYVLDSACLFTKALKKPVSDKCAKECGAAGSPLVILSSDDQVYLPIDKKMPAHGQNPALMKYGGKSVKVTGEVYERGGSKAIVIETIAEAKATAK